MKDKTEQIMQAAAKVFIRKGLRATTQEIAQEANVAEITLYRKFSTKQNLFVTVIQKTLEKQFNKKIMRLAELENTEQFFSELIDNRLTILSKNTPLVKMLISESLKGNLADNIDFPAIIYTQLKKALDHHFTGSLQKVDTEFYVRQLSGIFLSYIILPNKKSYDQLNDEEKKTMVQKHVKALTSLL